MEPGYYWARFIKDRPFFRDDPTIVYVCDCSNSKPLEIPQQVFPIAEHDVDEYATIIEDFTINDFVFLEPIEPLVPPVQDAKGMHECFYVPSMQCNQDECKKGIFSPSCIMLGIKCLHHKLDTPHQVLVKKGMQDALIYMMDHDKWPKNWGSKSVNDIIDMINAEKKKLGKEDD